MSVVRAAELQKWAAGEGYRSILSGDYPRRAADRDVRFTDEARAAADNYRNNLRESADPLAKVVTNLGGVFSDASGTVRRWIRPNGPAASEPEATSPDEDSTADRSTGQSS